MKPMDPWILCPQGCGFHHRHGDPNPVHSREWLENERYRLQEISMTNQDALNEIRKLVDSKPVMTRSPGGILERISDIFDKLEMAKREAARVAAPVDVSVSK